MILYGIGAGRGAAASPVPLREGDYDANYRDAFGRKAGERGFVPPMYARAGKTPAQIAELLPEGFDEHFVDPTGHRAGESAFAPPCYDDTYVDANGKRPGQAGFVPPRCAGRLLELTV